MIVPSITREAANQSYSRSGPPSAISSRAPSRLPSTTISATAPRPARTALSGPRAAAQSVAASGEDGGRGEREQRRDGDVVALVRAQVAELDEHAHREVAEVVVVEVAAGEPRVLGRERLGAVGGVEERHVHRLLGQPDVRRVGDEEDGGREGHGEDRLGGPEEARAERVGLRDAGHEAAPPAAGQPAARLPAGGGPAAFPAAHEGEQPEGADERDPERGAQPSVRDQRERAAHPHEPRDEGQAEHLAQAETRARQAREHDSRQGRRAEPDQLDERPEAQRLGHGEASSRVGGTASVDSGAHGRL